MSNEMTNEEAINLLDLQLHGTPEQIERYGSYQHATAIRMAIAALKAKSCENNYKSKIDEFELKGKTAEIWIVKGKLQIRYLGIIHNIPLPSITAKQRTGKWKIGGYNDDFYVCDCGFKYARISPKYNYCPKCGIKMDGEMDSQS